MIDQTQLAEALGQLDAGTRALLDLSLRRAIPDDKVAKVLGVDAASIPPKRARGIAELADAMEIPGPAELAALLIAIPDLPEEAWGVPTPAPFTGSVSRARRAKAFRRVAVAASPLVAVGAVMAAVLVSSGDHSGGGSGSTAAHRGAGGAGAGGGAAATASAPEARHGLPPGVQLTMKHQHASHRARHATARRHRSRHAPGAAEPAVLAQQPAQTVSHSQPVVFHPAPAPVQTPSKPKHVTHHHAPAKPKVPTQAPAPAPVETPSQPVSTPAPTTPSTPTVQINAPTSDNQTSSAPSPVKPPKTSPPPVNLNPPQQSASLESGDDDDQGGGCSHRGGSYGSGDDDHGSSHHDWQGSAHEQSSNGRRFTPPGLFRRRH